MRTDYSLTKNPTNGRVVKVNNTFVWPASRSALLYLWPAFAQGFGGQPSRHQQAAASKAGAGNGI